MNTLRLENINLHASYKVSLLSSIERTIPICLGLLRNSTKRFHFCLTLQRNLHNTILFPDYKISRKKYYLNYTTFPKTFLESLSHLDKTYILTSISQKQVLRILKLFQSQCLSRRNGSSETIGKVCQLACL